MAQWIKALDTEPSDLFYSHILEGENLKGVHVPGINSKEEGRKGDKN